MATKEQLLLHTPGELVSGELPEPPDGPDGPDGPFPATIIKLWMSRTTLDAKQRLSISRTRSRSRADALTIGR